MATSVFPDVVDAGVRFDEHIAEAAERLAAGGHDLDVEQALLGLPGRHVGVDGADGQQHVIQAIEDGGRGFRRRKQRNRRSGLIWHDQSSLARILSHLPCSCAIRLLAAPRDRPSIQTKTGTCVTGGHGARRAATEAKHGHAALE